MGGSVSPWRRGVEGGRSPLECFGKGGACQPASCATRDAKRSQNRFASVKFRLGRYGSERIRSLSFDKGFTREEDRQLLELYIPEGIMPKRGKRNAAEEAREGGRSFQRRRGKHHAVESAINCLEHHGLNRCPDKGYNGYKRYVGFGVLAYNLHKIGRRLLERRARCPASSGLYPSRRTYT